MTMLAWNGGTLAQSRIAANTLMLQIMRELDEGFYQLYLEIIADFVEQGTMSKGEAVKKYWEKATNVMLEKY